MITAMHHRDLVRKYNGQAIKPVAQIEKPTFFEEHGDVVAMIAMYSVLFLTALYFGV